MAAKVTTSKGDVLICTSVFLPMRANPSHRAEMLSQVLFGERFIITDNSANWLKIRTLFDDYEGWADALHGGFEVFDGADNGVITGDVLLCSGPEDNRMVLAPGSELFNLSGDFAGFCNGGKCYRLFPGNNEKLTPASSVTETALTWLNTPYLWGGRTPWGVDCSGFVQIVFKIHGVSLPRDSSEQAARGKMITFIDEALPGDLLFFSGDGEAITHTGILQSKGRVIHASGRVRTDIVDHQGIWNTEESRYTHRLRFIRRIE